MMIASDEHIRKEIINSGTKNIVVSASAGCGKTSILVQKMLNTLEEISNHLTIAAITFTIKATEELKDRVKSNNIEKDIMICTNDSFIENEIIRPFIIDVLGEEFREDFIIDYNKRFYRAKEGLEILKNENILGVYRDNRKNFKFHLAGYILKNSIAAQQYLISKYKMLFLDEYQDSDEYMHNLFMFIKEVLDIPLFIVGDPKQAIYIWRGAKENIFAEFDNTFAKYELFHNFRSHINITNFSNLLHKNNYLDNKATENIEEIYIKSTDRSFNEAVYNLLQNNEVEKDKEITVIVNVNDAAEDCKNYLNSKGYDFEFIPRTPIDEGLLNSYVLRCIMRVVLDRIYNKYNFLIDLSLEINNIEINKLEGLIEKLKESDLDINKTKLIFSNISEVLNIEFSEAEVKKFFETLNDDKYHISFVEGDKKHKVMTVFATKGLEFKQVIIRASDYVLDGVNSLNNHYVALTRAEDKVVIIDNTLWYKDKLKKMLSKKGIIKLNAVAKIINNQSP